MLLADLLLPGSLLSPLDRQLKGTATVPPLPGETTVVVLSMGAGVGAGAVGES